MKRKLTIVWNVTIALFIALVVFGGSPIVARQFQLLDEIPEGTFRARVAMVGFEAIGLLVLITTGAFSLSSLFWRKVAWGWRALFSLILLASGIGVFTAIQIDLDDMGFTIYGDYITFLFSAIVIVFPILVFGLGYPNLLAMAYRKLRKPHKGEQDAAVKILRNR